MTDKLSQIDMDELILRARNGTQLARFNPKEAEGVMRWLEDNGYSLSKVKPDPVVIEPVLEPVPVKPSIFSPAPVFTPAPTVIPAPVEFTPHV